MSSQTPNESQLRLMQAADLAFAQAQTSTVTVPTVGGGKQGAIARASLQACAVRFARSALLGDKRQLFSAGNAFAESKNFDIAESLVDGTATIGRHEGDKFLALEAAPVLKLITDFKNSVSEAIVAGAKAMSITLFGQQRGAVQTETPAASFNSGLSY